MPCPFHNPQNPTDPFREPRERDGVLVNNFQGKEIPLVLRHEDVRRVAKDWQTFSSDAPFKVPIPTEEDVRTVRQLPLETDPPDQQAYREVVEPFFNRAKLPEVITQMERLVDELVTAAGDRVRIVAGRPAPGRTSITAVAGWSSAPQRANRSSHRCASPPAAPATPSDTSSNTSTSWDGSMPL
jgi:cytochrome P450